MSAKQAPKHTAQCFQTTFKRTQTRLSNTFPSLRRRLPAYEKVKVVRGVAESVVRNTQQLEVLQNDLHRVRRLA